MKTYVHVIIHHLDIFVVKNICTKMRKNIPMKFEFFGTYYRNIKSKISLSVYITLLSLMRNGLLYWMQYKIEVKSQCTDAKFNSMGSSKIQVSYCTESKANALHLSTILF